MSEISPIIAAVQTGELDKVKEFLAQDPSLAQSRDASGVSAIMHALYRQRADVLDLLLASSPTLDIFEAVSLGRIDRCVALLQSDPQLLSSWSADGFTALHFACFFRQEAAAKLLLERGADSSAVARNSMKVAPLHSAAAGHHVNIVRLLLEHGAQPNTRQQQGWTAVHSAAQEGDRAMLELLLKYGADPRATNDAGKTPLQLAQEKGHQEIARLLQAA